MSNKKLNLDCSHYYQSLIIDLILKLPLHQEIIALAYIASQRNQTHWKMEASTFDNCAILTKIYTHCL